MSVRKVLGRGRGASRGRFLFQGHFYLTPREKGTLVRSWRPGGHALAQALSNGLEDLLPHLRQRLVSLSLCARTANNQLKLADFSTFVRKPAALAQLSICRKGSREPEEKKKAFKSLFLFISPFSAPPLAVSTAMPLSSSSFFINLFITIFSFMCLEPLASFQ